VATFPVLYFFTFLYYTDAGSTLFILYSYLLCLQQRHCLSAAVGTVSVIFRQTNIVWVVFFGFCVVCETLFNTVMPDQYSLSKLTDHAAVVRHICSWLRNSLREDRRRLSNLICQILQNVWPYFIVCLAFLIFLWVNNGIVVGARHDHAVALHFPQLFYCAMFMVWFASVYVISLQNVIAFLTFLRQNLFFSLFLLLLCLTAIWRFTYVHRYLLADNRHYTFYIWSWLFVRRPLLRYAFAPLYVFAGYLVLRTLACRQHILWCLGYLLTVTALLVPATLLEFRYFIMPYIIFRLNIPVSSLRQLVTEICVYAGVNALTLYIFLHKTLRWDSEISPQRFMW